MKIHLNSKGFILPFLLITVLFIGMIGVSITATTISNAQSAAAEKYRVAAQVSADAGLDYAIHNLNQDITYTGTGGEQTLMNTTALRTTFESSVDDSSTAGRKIITSTGRAYSPGTATTPKLTRKYQVELEGITSGPAAVVTGVGGLFMSNSSKIVGGSVFVNGEITMSNNSQIGLSTNSVNVSVANQLCPIPANGSYPQLCTSGENDNPITFSNSAVIYGTVVANYQTSGANMYNPGLTAGSVSPQALPTHDRSAQKSAITSTITGASAGCNNGTKTWAANTKITGDVDISGSCKVTINGNIWITGNITLKNSSQIIISNSLTTTDPDIMVDGSGGLQLSNSSSIVPNTSSKGGRFITYYSRASCSPDCPNVNGTDLYNGRNDETIALNNNTSGAKTTFYAKWSRVRISNSGSIGALVGQTVALDNNSTITFGASVSGFSGPVTWVKRGYFRVFN